MQRLSAMHLPLDIYTFIGRYVGILPPLRRNPSSKRTTPASREDIPAANGADMPRATRSRSNLSYANEGIRGGKDGYITFSR